MSTGQGDTDPWPSDWMRGILAVAALAVLARGPGHGYAIATALSDAGLGVVKGGTLYPLLGRLETAGHLEAHWVPGEGGPGRKVYALTREGERHLRDRTRHWAAFTMTTTTLLESAPQDSTTSTHQTRASR